MGRPKMTKKERIIKFLQKNPDKIFTYGDLAKKFDSHALAIGAIMKSLYKTEHRALTEQVTHKYERMKQRKVGCLAKIDQPEAPVALVAKNKGSSKTAIRLSE